MVETLPASTTQEALADRVRLGCMNRCPQHADGAAHCTSRRRLSPKTKDSFVSSTIATPNWSAITPTVVDAWKATERRGAQLLFVIPFFGAPLLAAAYWGVPQTPVPALVVAAAMALAFLYVSVGRERLRTRNVLWLRSRITAKRIHQSTDSTSRQVARRHYLTLDVQEALALTRTGELVPADAPGAEHSTTTEIYERVGQNDIVWAAVMPHDGAIYFVVTGDGDFVGVPQEPTSTAA